MDIRCIVFDFDGTLVDSNQLKYDAYFELFPSDVSHVNAIRQVLSESFEQTRYVILEEILRRLGAEDGDCLRGHVRTLAERYNELVVARAKTCPERRGAEQALRKLASVCPLYLSSTTPQQSLEEIVRFRQWERYFRAVFGYPNTKNETLRKIAAWEGLQYDQILVVGDGESDRQAAQGNGAQFLHAGEGFVFDEIDLMLSASENRETRIHGRIGRT